MRLIIKRAAMLVLAVAFATATVSCDRTTYNADDSRTSVSESIEASTDVADAVPFVHPLDCPDSCWGGEQSDISFGVSSNGEVQNAKCIDVNGNIVDVNIVFSGKYRDYVSIFNAATNELMMKGVYNPHHKGICFYIYITDVYDQRFANVVVCPFKRVQKQELLCAFCGTTLNRV